MHAVSDQSFMSAVASVAKQVKVSVMDQLCKCQRRQNPNLHLHVVSLGTYSQGSWVERYTKGSTTEHDQGHNNPFDRELLSTPRHKTCV